MADKAKGVEIDPVREKLIELMKSFECPWPHDNEACKEGCRVCEADYLIANGVTVTDNNVGGKWIPVTERLPEIPDGWAENPEPVLYMMKNTKTVYAGYYGEGGVWRDKCFRQYADSRNGVNADDVLCWMWQHDLPEPPKGGQT